MQTSSVVICFCWMYSVVLYMCIVIIYLLNSYSGFTPTLNRTLYILRPCWIELFTSTLNRAFECNLNGTVFRVFFLFNLIWNDVIEINFHVLVTFIYFCTFHAKTSRVSKFYNSLRSNFSTIFKVRVIFNFF